MVEPSTLENNVPHPPIPKDDAHSDRRYILFCVLVVLAAVVAIWPVAEVGFGDDFSYGHIARGFAATGRLHYDAWAAVMLLPQIVWAAGFIKLFGFSFLVLRLSTVTLALLVIPVLYGLGRESGLQPPFAAFATLAVLLSPVTTPQMVSYLSDLPAFFLFALCLYSAVRAWKAVSSRSVIVWSLATAVAGFLSGLDRQSYWAAPLLFLPVIAIVQRRSKSCLPVAGAAWLLSAVAVVLSNSWFTSQPYALWAVPLGAYRTTSASFIFHREFPLLGEIVLTLTIGMIPVLAGFMVPGLRNARRKTALLVLAAAIASGLACLVSLMLRHSWMARGLTWYGEIPRGVWAMGKSLLVIGPLTLAGAILCCAGCLLVLWRDKRFLVSIPKWLSGPGPLLVYGALFTLALTAVILVRGIGAVTPGVAEFGQRYLIPMLPPAVFGLLWFFQQQVRPAVARSSWAALALVALYAIGVSHDGFAGARARVEAAAVLQSAGEPRRAVSAGFPYDMWTQLEITGHVNHPLIANPRGAYHRLLCSGPADLRPWWSQFTPSVQPRYAVTLFKVAGWPEVPQGRISYETWLPPGRHEVYTQQIPPGEDIGCR